MQKRYFLGVSLQEKFTHVQSPTTAAQLDSARRTTAPETQIHTNKVATWFTREITSRC